MRISDWSSDVCSSDLLTATLSDIARGAETMAVRLSDRARGTGQDAAMVAGATVQSLAGLQELGDRGRALADTMAQIVGDGARSEEHPSELQSLMRISYAVFCLKKKTTYKHNRNNYKRET